MARWLWLMGCASSLLALPTAAAARSWPVVARGQVLATRGGRPVPLAGVRVFLMDDDMAFDEELGAGRTDRSGRFLLRGRGGDTQWLGCDRVCSRPDVYVRIELPAAPGEPRWRVRSYATPVRRDRAGAVALGRILIPAAALRPASSSRRLVRAHPPRRSRRRPPPPLR